METEFDERSSKIGAAIAHFLLVSCGLTANGLLFYAIVRHTPPSFKVILIKRILAKKMIDLELLFAAFSNGDKRHSLSNVRLSANSEVCSSQNIFRVEEISRILPTPTIIAQVWHGACSLITKGSILIIRKKMKILQRVATTSSPCTFTQ